MLNECIILAGGLGTRLRSVVVDLPKVMAPVNERPFLNYILEKATNEKIEHLVLSTGYLHEKIEEYISTSHAEKNISFVIEEEPLGTGGAIAFALHQCMSEEVLIVNGDSFFNIDYRRFFNDHHQKHSDFSIAMKPMFNFDRYGTLNITNDGKIKAFLEKRSMQEGMINAGIYIINKKHFLEMNWPYKFSMEKDYMEKYFSSVPMYGFAYDEYFIDIGIPQDYAKAQTDFKQLFP